MNIIFLIKLLLEVCCNHECVYQAFVPTLRCPHNWYGGSFSNVKQLGMELNTHLHLVPWLRIYGVTPSFLYVPSWCGA
jgi:hypothetical protein